MKLVEEIMTDMPVLVQVPGNRNDAINAMVKEKVTGLPVIRASDGMLVGIISRRDVFRNLKETQLSLLMKKNPITISNKATIEEAARIFFEKRIHRLPVIEEVPGKGKKLVGIITPTDLLKEIKRMKDVTFTAEDAIRVKCATCYKEDPLSYVVNSMRISDVSAMPVLDENGKMVGIITDRDLFADQTKDVTTLKAMGLDDTCMDLAGYRNVLPLFCIENNTEITSSSVSGFMVRDPTKVFKKSKLNDVARIMYENDFGQIPVHGDNDELIGMVYDVDVLLALIGEKDE
ncbi:MAG: CBS domain-containing protein [Candidatus Methanomethylophilaceae archaeon]|nr:CBS domain-containing protein [Candidatus Methanomethylophilaceae archaeon]MDY5872358.1 CBS domain-containing protein [Candidatus Methanomethylophilaceae archaeon]